MQRLFLGLNLWGAVFLVASAALGWAGSPHHVRVSIFAAVFSCLIQSGVIALFMGAAKLTKAHVGRYRMPGSLIDRVNGVYHRLVPAAAIGATAMAIAAILGGLADMDRVPSWIHHVLAVIAAGYLIVIIPLEYRLHGRMHRVILDMERLLPPEEEAALGPFDEPHAAEDRIILDRTGRARAFLYVGLTLPLPYLGYTFIAGRDVSYLLVPTFVGTIALLAASAHQYRTPRG